MCFLDRVFVRLRAARDEKERNMNVLMSRPSNCEGETNHIIKLYQLFLKMVDLVDFKQFLQLPLEKGWSAHFI